MYLMYLYVCNIGHLLYHSVNLVEIHPPSTLYYTYWYFLYYNQHALGHMDTDVLRGVQIDIAKTRLQHAITQMELVVLVVRMDGMESTAR